MIWVIGAGGMLGRELCKQLDVIAYRYVGTDLEVDILRENALQPFIEENDEIDTIVNCAAYTAVDNAEEEKDKAYAINAQGVGNIARVAEKQNAKLVHISTDYVFDGESEEPIAEDHPRNPISVYGASKLEGEELARRECARLVIIRTAWLYGLYGGNFVFTMLRLMNEKETISVVSDQFGAPTNAADLAGAIISVIRVPSFVPGTYHYTGKGKTSWYEFATAIYTGGVERGLVHKKCDIIPVSSDEYVTKAKRPRYSLLSSKKYEETYGHAAVEWRISLDRFLTRLANTETKTVQE